MAESILKTKSYDFALRILKLSRQLADEKREFVPSKQILRSGTSIGANIEEANRQLFVKRLRGTPTNAYGLHQDNQKYIGMTIHYQLKVIN